MFFTLVFVLICNYCINTFFQILQQYRGTHLEGGHRIINSLPFGPFLGFRNGCVGDNSKRQTTQVSTSTDYWPGPCTQWNTVQLKKNVDPDNGILLSDYKWVTKSPKDTGTLKAYCEVKENLKRLLWDNRNSILVSVLFLAQSSWNPCKFLSNKSIRGIFCSSESSWMVPAWGLVIRNTKTWLEAQLVPAIPPSFRAGRGVGSGVNNWSCLHEEASIKSQ